MHGSDNTPRPARQEPASDANGLAPLLHDRVICRACLEEVLNPSNRRFRYPFAHCNNCGPRLTLSRQMPFRRANTVMAGFPPCDACMAEYADPTSRHYQNETVSCPRCGPRIKLIRFDGRPVEVDPYYALDDIDAACSLIQKGEVVAIKASGGYQLVCDATNPAAVVRLRRVKQSRGRPLPLMGRDLHVIAHYCAISVDEELQLTSPQGPLVVLRAAGPERLPEEVAPGLSTLAFMLPTSALHHLLLQRMSRPVIMTSANLSGKPQIIDDEEARETLGIAMTYALVHDQPIITRLDDSVVRIMAGRPRILRRARGYAPAPLKMPAGFDDDARLLAVGSDRKASFCLITNGQAIPSAHYGALTDRSACAEYRDTICHFRQLHHHDMTAIAIDPEPGSFSAALARDYAARVNIRVIEVDGAHAHVAACLAENSYPRDAGPVLGIVLSGDNGGERSTSSQGHFLLADYSRRQSVGMLKPIALAEDASDQPWRSLHAHLTAAFGWDAFKRDYGEMELCRFLEARVRELADAPMRRGGEQNSSGVSLFDAVAAALGICRDGKSYPGEAGARLESIVDEAIRFECKPEKRYPVEITEARDGEIPVLDPAGLWRSVLRDLAGDVPHPVIAARFHIWLAGALAAMARRLARPDGVETPRFTSVALSGACFQNRVLLEETANFLRQSGFHVLCHALVPPHDGGLALGQAAVGAAKLLEETARQR